MSEPRVDWIPEGVSARTPCASCGETAYKHSSETGHCPSPIQIEGDEFMENQYNPSSAEARAQRDAHERAVAHRVTPIPDRGAVAVSGEPTPPDQETLARGAAGFRVSNPQDNPEHFSIMPPEASGAPVGAEMPVPAPPADGEPALVEVVGQVEPVVWEAYPQYDPEDTGEKPAASQEALDILTATLGAEAVLEMIRSGGAAGAVPAETVLPPQVSASAAHHLTLAINDAAAAKFEAGRAQYGDEWVGMPALFELEQEMLDAINYVDVANQEGTINYEDEEAIISHLMAACRLARRCIAGAYNLPVNLQVSD